MHIIHELFPSAGVVMFLLLSGNPPFKGDDIDVQFTLIKSGDITFPHDQWSLVSHTAKDLLMKLLNKVF